MSRHVLMVDNYDSFTYNLVQAFLGLGAEVTVRYNDEVGPGEAVGIDPTHLVVSPGPGRPEAAGSSMAIIEEMSGQIPILGVCLGHQAIAAVFGAEIMAARDLMHGKASDVHHDGLTIFDGLDGPFSAGRYHSLSIRVGTLPPELEVSATSSDGEIMAIRHRVLPIEGVQFHPESVLTPQGEKLMENFLNLAPHRTAVLEGKAS